MYIHTWMYRVSSIFFKKSLKCEINCDFWIQLQLYLTRTHVLENRVYYNYFVSSFKIHFTCTPACVHELILFLSRWSYHMFGHFVTLNGFAWAKEICLFLCIVFGLCNRSVPPFCIHNFSTQFNFNSKRKRSKTRVSEWRLIDNQRVKRLT